MSRQALSLRYPDHRADLEPLLPPQFGPISVDERQHIEADGAERLAIAIGEPVSVVRKIPLALTYCTSSRAHLARRAIMCRTWGVHRGAALRINDSARDSRECLPSSNSEEHERLSTHTWDSTHFFRGFVCVQDVHCRRRSARRRV
jgi:hypothetical protein